MGTMINQILPAAEEVVAGAGAEVVVVAAATGVGAGAGAGAVASWVAVGAGAAAAWGGVGALRFTLAINIGFFPSCLSILQRGYPTTDTTTVTVPC